MNNQKNKQPTLTPLTLWVMTISTGLVVANIYYNQPLLGDIAHTFNVNSGKAGQVSMLTQVGYATGMLFIVPLADMFRRKRLMLIDFAFAVAALLLAAFAWNIYVLLVASLLIGISSIIPQLLVPMAAHLAEPHERGKKIGTIMSGLLIGILLSRTLSGFVADHFGWRMVFIIAAGLMIVIWILIFFLLPEVEPDYKGTYGQLMQSLIGLIKTEKALRLAAIRGALCFACFSAFWTTLVFLLKEPQFNKGAAVAGAFGLVGAFGAIAAGLMGRLSDKMDAYHLSTYTILLVVLSFIIFIFSGSSLVGLVIGVILMDMGVQATHISNQAIILAINPAARNRMNTVYIVAYFTGGATGTFMAAQAWDSYHWNGVCIIGILLSTIALIVHLVNRPKTNS